VGSLSTCWAKAFSSIDRADSRGTAVDEDDDDERGEAEVEEEAECRCWALVMDAAENTVGLDTVVVFEE
jgi:hypothetical protein